MTEMRPKSRKEDLVVQEANGELLIYDIRSAKAFCLNETCALVWNACDGSRDISQISRKLAETIGSHAGDDLVWLALDQLKKESLLDPEAKIESRFEGMSRREVIRKIGLGSMVALPIVAGLIAPTPLHAQTCLANGTAVGTATLPGNCPSNSAAARDAACDAAHGAQCCSGNSTATGTCSGNPAVFACQCAP